MSIVVRVVLSMLVSTRRIFICSTFVTKVLEVIN